MVSVQELLDKGILIDSELMEKGISEELLARAVEVYGDDLLMIDQELLDSLEKDEVNPNKTKLPPNDFCKGNVDIIWSYDTPSKKRTYNDFVVALNNRFREIERMLKSRQEFTSTVSIGRIRAKSEKEPVSFIGMVLDKQETPNGHIIFTLEDMTGSVKALVSKNKSDLLEYAKDVQLDEVLGFTGTGGGDIVFIESIVPPDVPLTKEFKKSPVDETLVVIGDPHFGSKVFMKKEFERFLLWINGKAGNEEQRALAKKVNYIVITGDLVEGVGIYPGQEEDLEIEDITKQYEECARYLRQIPEHIHLVLFPGNHDAGRLSEPQEPLSRTYAKALWDLPNTTIVSNPSMVRIGRTETFPGFDVLCYHGGSFIYYSDNIPSIRAAGGQKRVDLIMKHLLQRRHLASTHNAALTIPDPERDYLLIRDVPDFFLTGHIHRTTVANYRNVTMVNSSCWTDTTEDQIKRGLEPQPARLIMIDLKTRGSKIMSFKKNDKT